VEGGLARIPGPVVAQPVIEEVGQQVDHLRLAVAGQDDAAARVEAVRQCHTAVDRVRLCMPERGLDNYEWVEDGKPYPERGIK